jgi:hypothetical protein
MKLSALFRHDSGSRFGWIAAFFARFAAASVLLYTIYMLAGGYYARLICQLARPVLAIFGRRVIISKALLITEDIALNPVVFLSLVAAAANVPLPKRLQGAVAGFAILTALNAITVALAFLSYYRSSEALWTGTEFVSLTINFFVPVLLAFVLLPGKAMLPPSVDAGGGSE